MRLPVLERLLLLEVLPRRGGIVELRVIQTASDLLALTAEEISEWGVEDVPGGGVKWNPGTSTETELDLSPAALALIGKVLTAKEEAGELTLEQVGLYEKFVETKPNRDDRNTPGPGDE